MFLVASSCVPCSRCQPLGVPWEHAGLPDVVKTKIQHGHSLKSNATTGMRRTSVSEAVNVGSNRGYIDSYFGWRNNLKLKFFKCQYYHDALLSPSNIQGCESSELQTKSPHLS